MRRREFISGLASTAALAGAAAPSWNAGQVTHILPTAADRRFLIKVSFGQKQERAPFLNVGNKLTAGARSDRGGLFWSFDVSQLQPAHPYELQLLASTKKPLCDPWTLKTLPDPNDRPANFRLLVYTCAGGDPDQLSPKGKLNYLSQAQRGMQLDRGLSYQPDAVIANGDHIYWDLRQGTYPPKLSPSQLANTGKFVRNQPVLGTPNEDLLRKVGDAQITDLYKTRLRGVPVFFLQDDHDYFENDDADDKMVTFPPDHFMLQLARATRRLYYPEFLPDAARPAGLPGASAADTALGTAESFGTLRFGQLAELLLYDCRRYLTLAGPNAVIVPPDVESWITARLADRAVTHSVQIPSMPPGWSAGKWGDWYPDILASDGSLTIKKEKPYWQSGWAAQHDRLLQAASAQRTKIPLIISGDMHSIAEGRITRCGAIDMRANPVISLLPGPLGTGQSWPSSARGVRAVPPHHLAMEEKLPCLEENGFMIVDFLPAKINVKFFRWSPTLGDQSISSLAPFRETQIDRPS